VLVGRRTEQARLDQLIGGLGAGRSAAMVIRGEPGVGKTALLEYASERAVGARRLAATGFEAERELPYAGLSLVLASVKRAPGRRALASALSAQRSRLPWGAVRREARIASRPTPVC